MAADKQNSAANRRRARLSGWVLSQFQVTLAVCGIVVGFLVCFGVGFLSGVWFQTQGQLPSQDEAIALADGQLDRERTDASPSAEREMTFYTALPSRDGSPEPLSSLRDEAASGATPQEISPAVSSAVAASLQTPAPEKRGPEKQAPEKEIPHEVEKGHATSVTAAASEQLFYSVQVGSFRQAEQAYHLQDQLIKKGYEARTGLSIVPGNGAWYRVRVGRYTDRSAADQTAQRLQESEKMDVLVMRDSS